MPDVGPIYIYKGQKYFIFFEALMKHPVTRKWVNAVVYLNLDDESRTYVREKEEFFQRFKLKNG